MRSFTRSVSVRSSASTASTSLRTIVPFLKSSHYLPVEQHQQHKHVVMTLRVNAPTRMAPVVSGSWRSMSSASSGRSDEEVESRKMAELLQLANGGDSDAQYRVGRLLMMEKDNKQAQRQAIVHLTNAAIGENVAACAYLSTMYATGRGVARNNGEAVRWMKKAADLGDTDSQQRFAQCLASGTLGVTRDSTAAIRWLQTAAVQGHPKAMFQWAQLLATGSLVLSSVSASPSSVTALTYAADPKSAFEWLEKSARAGYVDAARELALAYLQGVPPLHVDMGLAVDWFKRAADAPQPDHESTAYLGELYKTNQVPDARTWPAVARLSEAARYLTRAADNGVAVAQRSLGFLYAHGAGGLQRDVNQAVKWLSVAAESAGLLDAQLMVTILAYQQGGDAGRDAAIETAKRLRDGVIASSAPMSDDTKQQLMVLHEDPARAVVWITNYQQRTGAPWLGGPLDELFIQPNASNTTGTSTSSATPPSSVLNNATASTNIESPSSSNATL